MKRNINVHARAKSIQIPHDVAVRRAKEVIAAFSVGKLLTGEEGGRDAKAETKLKQAQKRLVEEGSALWEETANRDELLRKARANPLDFQMTYQGYPSVPEGNIFRDEWWQFSELKDLDGTIDCVFQVYDCGFKVTKESDYSACATFGVDKNEIVHLLHVWWDKLEFPDMVAFVKDHASWLRMGTKPGFIFIEDSASGTPLIQSLTVETQLPIVPIPHPVTQGKEARAHSVTSYIKTGRVRILRDMPWTDAVLNMMGEFPHGRHDDVPDTIIHGIRTVIIDKYELFFESDPSKDTVQVSLNDMVKTDLSWRNSGESGSFDEDDEADDFEFGLLRW